MAQRFLIGVSALAVLALAGCSQQGAQVDYSASGGTKAKTSEQLLAAKGSWALVEEHDTPDPVDMHKNARKKVNPNNRAKRQFVPQDQVASASGRDDDVNFRLIRMEPDPATTRGRGDTASGVRLADMTRVAEPVVVAEAPVKPPRKPQLTDTQGRAHDDQVAAVLSRFSPAAGANTEGRVAATDVAVKAKVNTVQNNGDNFRGNVVNGIRFGDHPGKTRMVLDVSADAQFKADVDNSRHVLRIELPQSGWSLDQEKALDHPLIKRYTAQRLSDGGTVLALELKKPVKVLGSAALKPNMQFGHRIYLDLAAS